MRVTLITLLFISSGFWLSLQAQSQIETTSLDSISIVKPKMHGNLYQFTDNGPKEIQYRNIDNVLSKDSSRQGLNGFSSAVLTELTGLGSSSKKEGYWKVSGAINCNDTLPEWQVFLFCKGYQQKDRERTRNDDGSVSMTTNKTNIYYWNKNATGAILESTDTVCFFQIITDIPEDELVKKWHEFIFNKPSFSQSFSTNAKLNTVQYFSYGMSYELTGKFRGKNFVLIQNGNDRKAWIFFDDLLACMFQGDIDYKGVSKKSRNLPYLLINKEIPAGDRRYILRLAIMSRFVNNYLDLYRY